MKRRKFLVSLLLALLMLPLHVFAEEPTYAFTDAEVLARGQLYYSSLNQFFSNVANDNGNAAEVTLTGAIGFCDTDYWVQSEFDARVAQGTTYGPCLYIEYVVTDQNGHSKTGYSYDLLPVGGHFNEGLAKLNYTTAVKNFSGGSGISILGNGFVKDSLNYKVRIDLSDYAAKWLGHDRHPSECDCQRAAREKREAAESQQKHLETVEDLKRRGFTDPAMRNWTFEHDNGRNPQTATARFYVESWETMQAENIGYLFWGGVGTGKSYLAACIANALMEKEVAVCMTNFATILNDLAASFEGRNEYISRLCSYPLLILDDFGMERGTEYGLEQVYSVIDSRYRSGKPLIATTNLTLEELQHPQDTPHARIYDRLTSMCAPVRFTGSNFRKETAQEKLERLKQLMKQRKESL